MTPTQNAITYENFDLIIGRIGEARSIGPDVRCTIRVIKSPAGELPPVIFTLPFNSEELHSFFGLRGHTRDIRLVNAPVSQTAIIDPRSFGTLLYTNAFANGVDTLFQRSLDDTQRKGQGLRIRLRFDSPDLADLPWEYLYQPGKQRFLATSTETVILRYIESDQQVKPLKVDLPLNILVVISNPGGDFALLDVEREWQHLQEAVADLQAAKHVQMERLTQPTRRALQDRLRTGDVHILHFIGHGYFDSGANSGGLVLEGEHGKSDLVEAVPLSVLLADRKALRLVFLNSCQGARSGRKDAFSGVAQRLVQQGIPAVLAMQFEVTDDAAITLAREFYASVVGGYPVDAAVAEARKAIYVSGNNLEWGTPVLFSRSDDNLLIELSTPQLDLDFERHFYEPETVPVANGYFLMGSQPDADIPVVETPQHSVFLPAYCIGIYPVTNGEYARFIADRPEQSVPGRRWIQRRPPPNTEGYPVVAVSWFDAVAYCRWLTERTERIYRLPTEAEWEKAARGTKGQAYPWGADQEAYHELSKQREVTAVTALVNGERHPSHPQSISPYGCYDMLGNVEEWTSTIWGTTSKNDFRYPYDPRDGRQDIRSDSTLYRVCRGGLLQGNPGTPQCTTRRGALANSKTALRGFRVVLSR